MVILVIDDDATLRKAIRRLLEVAGHAVLEAGEGEAALNLLDRERVDVVLTDLYMPKVDGIELIRSLRKKPTSMRIVAMSVASAAGPANMLELAQRLGAAILPKPFTNEELLAAVIGRAEPAG
jgi:CheY-like chemotaxis protein